MSCLREIKKLKGEAAAKPDRDELGKIDRSRVEYQLGYRLGFHHALEEAEEIAEECPCEEGLMDSEDAY